MRGMLHPTACAAALLALGACQQGKAPGPEASGSEMASAAPDQDGVVTEEDVKKSIIRADIDTKPAEAPPLEPLELTVPFPAGSVAPDAAGRALIDGVLTSPAFIAGGAVMIRGYSDSRGSDTANLSSSRRRAEAVRDYLKSRKVDPGRLIVIAMGEDRPIAPNRKLDGSEDSEGQAKNRRVEITVTPPPPSPGPDIPASPMNAPD